MKSLLLTLSPRHLVTLSVSALLGLAAFVPLMADAPGVNKDLSANAAIYYWQAIQMLPKLDATKEKLLEEWNEGPPPADIQKLFDDPMSGAWPASLKQALNQLHRGAKLTRCEWGIDYDQGMETLLPHVQEARMLASWACWRARAHFEAGRHQAGVDDIIAALTLARHVGSDPIPICILVQYAIERIAINEVSPYLSKMDPAALKNLAARLETRPQGSSLKAAVLVSEKEYWVRWILKKMEAISEDKPDELIKLLQDLMGEGGDENLKKKIIASAGKPPSRARIVKQIQAMQPYYDELATLMDLPWKEFEERWPAFDEKIKKLGEANPLLEGLLPSFKKVRTAEARTAAMHALLKAGIAVVQGGPEKLKDHPDPYGDGPFEYRKLEKGFELKSKLQAEDKVTPTLTVGQRKKD